MGTYGPNGSSSDTRPAPLDFPKVLASRCECAVPTEREPWRQRPPPNGEAQHRLSGARGVADPQEGCLLFGPVAGPILLCQVKRLGDDDFSHGSVTAVSQKRAIFVVLKCTRPCS